MTGRFFLSAGVFFLLGCGGTDPGGSESGGGNGDPVSETEALACSLTEMRGTWEIQFEEIEGDCGPLLPGLTWFADDQPDETNPMDRPIDLTWQVIGRWHLFFCDVVHGDQPDETCSMFHHEECYGDQYIGTLRQVNSHRIVGRLEVIKRSCQSTYEEIWTRQ